jgi:superfamily I DNA/RNA helicase/mRNA-degrading endonuclease YafQ of YafQ-DinJ toxin-antitoxin module
MVVAPVELVCTPNFIAALERLQDHEQKQVRATVAKLMENPHYPGLQAHRVKHAQGKWECYVNDGNRLIYEPPHADEPLRLWYVGTHKIIDGVRQLSFAETTRFVPVPPDIAPMEETAEPSEQPPFQMDEAWLRPTPGDTDNTTEIALAFPLAHYSTAHLRFLGVPRHLVQAVQHAPGEDAILALPGLPEHAKTYLLDLFTNPRLQDVLFDPSRLLYRTTLDMIEGFCEGRIKKLMLNLTPTQERYVQSDQAGMVVLRGVAGSGKTTVGVYRACARARAGRQVLLLTFNKTLVAALRSLVEELAGTMPPNLTIETVDSCLWQTAEKLNGRQLQTGLASDVDQRQWLQAAARSVAGAADLARREYGRFFSEEIEAVLHARGLFTWAAYRDAPRLGRGTPLGKVQRRIVWDVFTAYREQLRMKNKNDAAEIAYAVFRHPSPFPSTMCYDDIIIDETQDITLLKLQAVARLLKPTTTEDRNAPALWLLADSAQTIYSRAVWWQEGDLPQPPHRMYLHRNHRNTLQIATAAARLAEHNTLRARDVTILKPERATHAGPPPLIIACGEPPPPAGTLYARSPSRSLQERFIIQTIQDLCDGTDFRYSDFAVLTRTRADGQHVAATIGGAGIPVTAQGDRLHLLDNTVKVLTFHSAKGLEFPVVFIFNAVAELVPLAVALHGLEGEDLAREIERERALLYVAMTRAADMLYILTDDAQLSPFLAELGDTVQRESLIDRAASGNFIATTRSE